MNNYRASEKLYRFGEKHRPEKYIKNGVLDNEAWIRDYYQAFCKKFGAKPKRNESIRVTEARNSLEADIYTFEKAKTGIISVKEERELRKRINNDKERRKLLEKYFPWALVQEKDKPYQ